MCIKVDKCVLHSILNNFKNFENMTTHIVCIGGSGLRVLRSMVMLLSSGYDLNSDIKAYIIDPHLSSTEYEFTTGLIKRYKKIRGKGGNIGFFKTKLDVDDNQPNGMSTITRGESFGDFIKYSQMNDASKQIVDILYNKGNIDNSMDVGFKGHPNVGCVVLQDLVQDNWFTTNFSNLPTGDRVVVIGSLFGGTGASGIQTIAQALHDKNPQLEIAAITFIPYYKLQEPPQGVSKDVDSASWDIKSWAALKYYQHSDFGIDSFYVIGDGDTQAIPYDETKQGNKSHFVELIAVSAIKHFINTPAGNLQKWNMNFTKWSQDEKSDLNYALWGAELKEEISCLANFYAFGKFFTMMREDRLYPVNKLFYKKANKETEINERLKDIESIIFSDKDDIDSFARWIGEMRENKRSFTAVNTSDIKYTSSGNVESYRFAPITPNAVYNGTDILKGVTMSDYFMAINKAYRKSLKVEDQTDKVTKFLNLCYEGIISINNQ